MLRVVNLFKIIINASQYTFRVKKTFQNQRQNKGHVHIVLFDHGKIIVSLLRTQKCDISYSLLVI